MNGPAQSWRFQGGGEWDGEAMASGGAGELTEVRTRVAIF